jgi:hypothetical protein
MTPGLALSAPPLPQSRDHPFYRTSMIFVDAT